MNENETVEETPEDRFVELFEKDIEMPAEEELEEDALEQDFAGVETNDEFIERRDKLVDAMMKDPTVFYKCIAENYIYLNALDTAVRKMQASGGIGGIMKMMLGRG
jgi:hypothetical protein